MIELEDGLYEIVQCHRPLLCDEYSKYDPAMLVSTEVEHRIEGGVRVTHRIRYRRLTAIRLYVLYKNSFYVEWTIGGRL